MSRALSWCAALSLLAAAGCQVDPYCIDCHEAGTDMSADASADASDAGMDAADAGPPDLGFDMGPPDLGPDACTGIDFMTSLHNCGGCGIDCAPPGAFGLCVGGMCTIGSCDVGFVDLDHMASNGCEYHCAATATNDVLCDAHDNDCDGLVDEDVMFMTDAMNCGSCGRTCNFPHATGMCSGGTCMLGACVAGFYDIDGVAMNGCEYSCTPSGAEVCDRIDNDCNGVVDDGDPGGGGACGMSVGACVAGVNHCVAGSVRCTGSVGPSMEVCDGVDNDCNGTVDDGFLTNDVNNCGMCGHVCTFANGVAGCSAMACVLLGCNSGFVDLDHNPANGCEYACDFAGTEVCNGRDDDCNGMTDDGLTPPPLFCNANGVCAGTPASCSGAGGWTCSYPAATYQITETRCDGLDNDCDGMVDEAQPLKGTPCSNGVGVCRMSGMYVCTADGSSVMCNAAAAGMGTNETCNGVDDDCDGLVDETRASPGTSASYVQMSVVQVAASLWMMQYEAVRPDATAAAQGGSTARACSAPGLMPWTNLTYPQAVAACTAAGMRLCTEAEWLGACQAGAACGWSYSAACSTYAATKCNGADYDTDAVTPGNQDAVLPTGSMAMCYANVPVAGPVGGHVFDMSGNVKEWAAARAAGINPMRGGADNNTMNGIRCNFNFSVANDAFLFDDVGFRCCSGTAP